MQNSGLVSTMGCPKFLLRCVFLLSEVPRVTSRFPWSSSSITFDFFSLHYTASCDTNVLNDADFVKRVSSKSTKRMFSLAFSFFLSFSRSDAIIIIIEHPHWAGRQKKRRFPSWNSIRGQVDINLGREKKTQKLEGRRKKKERKRGRNHLYCCKRRGTKTN